MNSEVSILRLLHILPGVLWAGGAVLSTFVIMPIVMRQAPPVRKAVLEPLSKAFSMYLLAMGAVTIIFGMILVSRTPGRGYGELFTTGWGWSIGLGMIAAIVAWVIGLMVGRAGRKMGALGRTVGDGPPTPELAAEIMATAARLKLLSRTATVLVVFAVCAMAVARWV